MSLKGPSVVVGADVGVVVDVVIAFGRSAVVVWLSVLLGSF